MVLRSFFLPCDHFITDWKIGSASCCHGVRFLCKQRVRSPICSANADIRNIAIIHPSFDTLPPNTERVSLEVEAFCPLKIFKLQLSKIASEFIQAACFTLFSNRKQIFSVTLYVRLLTNPLLPVLFQLHGNLRLLFLSLSTTFENFIKASSSFAIAFSTFRLAQIVVISRLCSSYFILNDPFQFVQKSKICVL